MNRAILAAALIWLSAPQSLKAAEDALPSWNDGAAKSAITSFVVRVTTEGSPDFVAPAERVAVFDNDGTLWCEQPMYFQLAFVLDRIKTLAPEHPEWKEKSPFKEVLAGDVRAALAGGDKAIVGLIMATHAGMTTDEYDATVRQWLKTAVHPRFKRPYNECVYQPMIEVLDDLRANDFKTFIVSGGGVEFMRVWADQAYGIPPEQVVGSAGKLKYEVHDGQPLLLKLPEVDFIDDHAGKPVGIEHHIGRRPILAFGNSDGDFEMLEWTTAGEKTSSEPGRPRPRLGLLVHHTDAEREYAYDRDSPIGQLKRGLDEAAKRGWILIDMKHDWKTVFTESK
jgi:phosphoglycolate phosphatase-like HAD superfamily hydrolase